MTLQVFDSERRIVAEEFLLRIPGWTWERYLTEAPETQICEYEHGELIVHSPARRSHQEEVGLLTYLLRGMCSRRGLGRVYNGPSVLRVPGDVGREPDIVVVSAAEAPRVLQQEDYVATVPVLIVEVLSKSTRALDLVDRIGASRVVIASRFLDGRRVALAGSPATRSRVPGAHRARVIVLDQPGSWTNPGPGPTRSSV
jgi:hypothetical protein